MKLDFPAQCRAAGLPAPTPEYLFAADYWQGGLSKCSHKWVKRHRCTVCGARQRQWRFDWAFDWLAVEVQGGIFSKGRHVRGAALLDEYEKINHAVLLGWFVLFMTPQQMDNGEAVAFIQKVLQEDER